MDSAGRCARAHAAHSTASNHAYGGALALRLYMHPLEENRRRAAVTLDQVVERSEQRPGYRRPAIASNARRIVSSTGRRSSTAA